jgi:large repetitive protein
VDATATLKVDAPSSAVTYTWYNGKEDNATALATAEEYTTTAITAPAKYYVEAADAVTGCSNWDRIEVAVAPIAKPTVAVTKDELWACSGNTVTFEVKDASSAVTYKWFNAASGGTEVHQGNTYTTPAVTVASDFSVQAYSAEGCTNDIRVPVKTISIAYPAIAVVTNSQQVCLGEEATFSVKTPETGIIYTWYDAATAGTTKGTGTSYTAQAASANQEYWVGAATTEGCTTGIREHVVLTGLQKLTVVPDVTADSLAADLVRFKWAAVPGATSYDVSTDGVNFVTPSSGSTGLTHTISGLSPLQTVSLYVRARAVIECQDIISLKTELRSLTGTFFVPNMFSPNGDGKNEVFQLYGNTIQSSKMMIYNQWGEKIFETQDAKQGWNGFVKGTQSSVGVYIYVISIVFRDGTTQNLKGTLNLIR